MNVLIKNVGVDSFIQYIPDTNTFVGTILRPAATVFNVAWNPLVPGRAHLGQANPVDQGQAVFITINPVTNAVVGGGAGLAGQVLQLQLQDDGNWIIRQLNNPRVLCLNTADGQVVNIPPLDADHLNNRLWKFVT